MVYTVVIPDNLLILLKDKKIKEDVNQQYELAEFIRLGLWKWVNDL